MSDVSWIASNIDILNNIAASMAPIQRMVSGFAYIMGICFAIKALICLRQYGESRSSMMSNNASMKEPLVYMLVAGMMIYFPTGLAVLINTTFGTSSGGTILAYAPTQSNNNVLSSMFGTNSMVGESIVMIIQTIGIIAFVRGWVLISRAAGHGQQPGGTGKGLVHIFGGLLAMNIVLTLEIVNNTIFGT